MDQYEEITLSGNDKPLREAADRSNKALDSVGAKVESINRKVAESGEKAGTVVLAVSSKTSNSIERLKASAQLKAANFGVTSEIEKLEKEMQIAIGRARGYSSAVDDIRASYQKMIATQQQIDLAAAFDRGEKKAREFEQALRRVNAANKEAAESRSASIQAIERRAALVGATATSRVDIERGFALQDLGKSQTEIDRINTAFDRLRTNVVDGTGTFVDSAKAWIASLVSIQIAYTAIHKVVAVVGDIVSQSRNFAELDLSLGALFKDAKAGTRVFTDLLGVVREFPRAFTLESISKNAQILAAFKFSAAAVPEILRQIAGAAVLGSDKIDRLILATGQIKSKGLLQAEEALQFAEAGVEIYGSLATAAGVSEREIRKLGEKGFLKADAVLPVILAEIEKTFSGAQRAVAQQSRTIEARLKADLLQAAIPLGDALDKVYQGALRALEGFVPVIRKAGEGLQGFNDLVGKSQALVDALVFGAGLASGKVIDLQANREELRLEKQKKLLADQKKFNEDLKQFAARNSGGDLFDSVFGRKGGTDSLTSSITKATEAQLTRERAIELFGAVQGRQIADQYKLVSLTESQALANKKNLEYSISTSKAKDAEVKSLEKAVREQEHIAAILRQLGDDRQTAAAALAAGDTVAGKRAAEYLKVQRELEKATPAQQFEGAKKVRDTIFDSSQLESIKLLRDAEKKLADGRERANKRNIELQFGIKVANQNTQDSIEKIFEQTANRRAEAALQSETESLNRGKEMEIASLTSVAASTIQQKILVEQRKLEIEAQFLQKSQELELRKLALKRDITLKSLNDAALRADSSDEIARLYAEITGVQRNFEDEARDIEARNIDIKKTLSFRAAGDISRIQIEEQDRVFDRWQQSYSRTLDALFSTTRSWGDRMKGLLEAFILTPLKESLATAFATLTVGSRGTQTGRQTGGFGGLLSGIFSGGSGGNNGGGGFGLGSIFNARAPGGTGTFSGAPVGGGSNGGGFLGLLGGGATSTSKAGLGGFLSSLKAFGNLGIGKSDPRVGGGDFGGEVAGTGRGVGGFGGAALLIGGGILAADGLRRGGLVGLGETTAGGALIGAKFGGPIGALIGGAIGFGAGFVRLFIKGAEDKAQREIRNVYGIDVTEKNIVKMVVDIAKQQYGGNLAMAVRSAQVADLIQNYGMATGKYSSAIANIQRPVLFLQRGGQLYQQAQFAGSNAVSFQSPIPSLTPTQVLPNGLGTQSVTLQLDGPTTERVLEGRAVQAMAARPGAVAKAATTGYRQNSSRGNVRGMTLEPLTV